MGSQQQPNDGAVRQYEVAVNDITMRVTEQGQGPAVVLCHGFPGLGYSWRHQFPALAAAGYRAIAPDMRGYGATTAPADPHAYAFDHTVPDMTGLLDALDIDRAVFVGHDFGAALTWAMPHWAPDRVRAIVPLSVPRMPPTPVPPSEIYARLAQRHFMHFDYFAEPGVAEAELDPRPGEFLQRVFFALSGAYRYQDIWQHPSEVDGRRNGYLDVLPPAPPLPWPWMDEAEFAVYERAFAATGFRGGLNWYRAGDRNWELHRAHAEQPVEVPVLFVAGRNDTVVEMMAAGLDGQRATVPDLRGIHLVEGAGHFVQMEAADETNRLLLDFLAGLD